MANGMILYQQINIFKLHSIAGLCKDLDIRLLPIRPEDRNIPLGVLAGIMAGDIPTAGFGRPDISPSDARTASSGSKAVSSEAKEMLVFCGLTPDLLDRFLKEYHQRDIGPIALKAVLTAYNAKWTPKKLQTELIKENRL